MSEPSKELDAIARQIVDSSILVHKELGAGLLEGVYEICLSDVLTSRGLAVARQVVVPVKF